MLKEKIQDALKAAMKNKDTERLTALRGLKSALMNAETAKPKGEGLSEAEEAQILQKAAKQRRNSLEIYQKEGRDDLAAEEQRELKVIEEFLPKMMDEGEVRTQLEALIAEVGATGPKDMGKVMGRATKHFAGKADNKLVASLTKELLS